MLPGRTLSRYGGALVQSATTPGAEAELGGGPAWLGGVVLAAAGLVAGAGCGVAAEVALWDRVPSVVADGAVPHAAVVRASPTNAQTRTMTGERRISPET
jgi:hypothetical protein